jgi:hypothetical protein
VSQSYFDPTPTKEQPRSILNDELKCNIVKTSRDDRNGYIICHNRSSESEDISRTVGFGKIGITSSSGLRLTQIIVFWNGHEDVHEPTKDGPGLPPPGTDRPHEEADQPATGPVSIHLLEASSTVS